MKEITFIPSGHETNKILQAAFESAERHGVKANVYSSPRTKLVACWGWRLAQEYRNTGHEVLVFERGYLGDRFKWTSIGWNGLNGYADFCLPDSIDFTRLKNNFKLLPWRREWRPLFVICGQIRGDASLQGRDLTDWYRQVAAELQDEHPGAEVRFKPHPAANDSRQNFNPRLPIFSGDMADAVGMAQAIVCWNSNSAVDAVMAGCPAITFDRGSMAYDVTGHSAQDIIMPDREAWAARLAWCQWTLDEISAGDFWGRMLCKVDG